LVLEVAKKKSVIPGREAYIPPPFRVDEREELVDRILYLHGREPQNLRPVLNILVVPSVIPFAKRYINGKDSTSRCLYFPGGNWNCARESEAKIEHAKFDALLQGGDIGYQWWCENCRTNAMEM
jgi:hypothetical protein